MLNKTQTSILTIIVILGISAIPGFFIKEQIKIKKEEIKKTDYVDIGIETEDDIRLATPAEQEKILEKRLVNINEADITKMQEIPGVGESTAKRIIEYRDQTGGFSKIEEIKNVKGIGDSKFNRMKEFITVGKNPPKKAETVAPAEKKININEASIRLLEGIPGVGPTTAKNIEEYRLNHGPFLKIEDIMNVKGIGPSTFDKMKDNITVGVNPKEYTILLKRRKHLRTTSPTVTSSGSSSSNMKKININRAAKEELVKIPGIGPSTAERIIEYRKENGRFNTIDELTNIPRIGPKTVEKIKKYISVR